MKAAVLRRTGAPLTIEDVRIADPVGREVLVRVAAVGVCHSDLHVIEGDLPHPMPTVLGHEAAGIVEAVGPEVRGVAVGDHVVVCLTFHCGRCRHCHGGNTHRCMTSEAMRGAGEPPRLIVSGDTPAAQFMNIGGFAEKVLVHDSGCVPIRRDIPLDRACLIGCGVTTGFGAAVRAAGVAPGDTVAVIGCGGVGLSAINGAAVAGAGRIIAIDRLAAKLDMARGFGATDAIDASIGDVVAQVIDLTGGGVDHAIEAIGRKQTIEDSYRMLGKGGTATVVGAANPDTIVELPALSLLREKRLQGSMMGGVRPAIDIPRYVDLYLDGRLHLDRLISRRRPLAEINEAFDDMRNGGVARSVIVFDT